MSDSQLWLHAAGLQTGAQQTLHFNRVWAAVKVACAVLAAVASLLYAIMVCLADVADEVCCAVALQLNFKGHKLNIITLMNE